MSIPVIILFLRNLFSNVGIMKTTSEIRLENLEILIREAGSVKRLSEKSGISRVYISQLRHQAIAVKTGNARNIGSETARKLEVGMSKPVGSSTSSITFTLKPVSTLSISRRIISH